MWQPDGVALPEQADGILEDTCEFRRETGPVLLLVAKVGPVAGTAS